MIPRVAAIIPARFASTRFPGKPLAPIDGRPMVVQVARRVQCARSIERVVVATDHVQIQSAVLAHGIDVILIPEPCRSGTDRVFSAVSRLGWEKSALILNIQGDEPLIDPAGLEALIDMMQQTGAEMGTLARPCLDGSEWLSTHAVKVEVSDRGEALDFSRAPPAAKTAKTGWIHLGVYAYPPAVLARFCRLGSSVREARHQLEQLRALDNGIAIQIARLCPKSPNIAVDTPEDLARVQAELDRIRALRLFDVTAEAQS